MMASDQNRKLEKMIWSNCFLFLSSILRLFSCRRKYHYHQNLHVHQLHVHHLHVHHLHCHLGQWSPQWSWASFSPPLSRALGLANASRRRRTCRGRWWRRRWRWWGSRASLRSTCGDPPCKPVEGRHWFAPEHWYQHWDHGCDQGDFRSWSVNENSLRPSPTSPSSSNSSSSSTSLSSSSLFHHLGLSPQPR